MEEELNTGIETPILYNVVADSCNPINLTRREWENIAVRSNSRYINIEVICSDKDEYRRRVENRCSEVAGLRLPTWAEIQNREYDAWETERIVIDTANKLIEESFEELKEKINLKSMPFIKLKKCLK